jgi:hypothetical protein
MLVASQNRHVEVIVPSRLTPHEQVQRPAAAGPPRLRESAHDPGDIARDERLPRPQVREVAALLSGPVTKPLYPALAGISRPPSPFAHHPSSDGADGHRRVPSPEWTGDSSPGSP